MGQKKMIKKYYCLSEYSYLYSKEYTKCLDKKNVLLEKEVFKEIEDFILEARSSEGSDSAEFLIPAYKKGIGKILKAQNYVGLIQTKSNVVIEILPKIYDDSSSMGYERTTKIFLKMLKELKDTPFKSSNLSNIKSGNMYLFDIFISMFLEELGLLIKKGIKSGYVGIEENVNFYKGKLLVNKHIAENIVHKERFYIEHDDYSRNRPENKIIKATLIYLSNKTNNYTIQSNIRKFLFAFEDIDASTNIHKDFAKCSSNRLFSDYDMILKWCRIFLKNESFTNFKGSSIAYSLLFPMERVFESFVAKFIKKSEYFRGYSVKTQHRKHYLIESPKRFALKPDIVLEKDDKTIILDTKWKLLNGDYNSNYGISQSDIYQMFAYGKKYKADDLFLIYPLNGNKTMLEKEIVFNYDETLRLNIFFVDLENMEQSMRCLLNRMKNCYGL